MYKNRFLIGAIAATLAMGGISPINCKAYDKNIFSDTKSDNKIMILTTPVQASEKLNEDVSNSNNINKKIADVESRILVKAATAPDVLPRDCEIYYYTVGGYYIIECKDKTEADRTESKLVSKFGDENVIRDRIVTQDETDKFTKDNVYSFSEDESENEEIVPFDGIHAMGMDSLKQDAKNWSGEVTVAVIDSGIDRDHDMLKGRIDEKRSINLSGREPEEAYDDTYGHGTHVSGIIATATPSQVKIMAVRVFDDYQMSSLTQITLGIDYARENGADVMNMSLGHTSPTAKECELINEAMEKSVEKGITLLAASGNEDNNVSTSTPANSSWTISVGAIEPGENEGEYVRSWYSNYGKRLDFVAPGTNIKSAWADGTEVIASGTSMATPHMAAAAAMIKLKYPDYNQWDIYATLQDYTVDLGDEGKDDYYGYGYVNLKDFANEKNATPDSKKYQAISAKAVTKTTMNYVGQVFTLNAKIQKGDGNLTFSTSDSNVADVKDENIIINGVGKCNITIKSSETEKYKETKRVVQVEVVKGQQEIEVPISIYEKQVGDSGFYIQAFVKNPGDGKITFITNENDVVDVTNDGFVTIKKPGIAYVYAVASATKNFKEQTGNAIVIKVTQKADLNESKTIEDNTTTNYTENKSEDNKNEKTKIQTTTALKSKPKPTKIYKAIIKKKSITLKWKAVKNVKGYEIQVASDKKFKKNKKTITVNKQKATSYVVNKLKAKKTYNVRIRTYNVVGGKKVYSAWSKVKAVKTK